MGVGDGIDLRFPSAIVRARGDDDRVTYSGPARRMYSFEVLGFRLHDGVREDQRFAKVVAAAPGDAIEAARVLISPDEVEAPYRWIIAGAIEMAPAEARDWIAWHAEAREG